MKIGPLNIGWEKKDSISLDTLIKRLDAAFETNSGVTVTPENCMESPTVQGIVTGVAKRVSSYPVHVLRKSVVDGKQRKDRVPDHPVQKLLNKPNAWQSPVEYWHDATSVAMRHGNFYALKSQGRTGPIRELTPLHPSDTDVVQDENWNVTYRAILPGGQFREYERGTIHHVRGGARNFVKGDSPIWDVRETIALEIAAEKFGSSFFGNGAMPGMMFKFMDGVKGFRDDTERHQFIEDFQAVYAKKGRFRAFLLPYGVETDTSIPIENDKAQFIETRQHQRSVIAGALGVPPHIAGDLSRATFSNIEHQSLEFVQAVVLPWIRAFEAAMERDLLSEADRNDGICIRFNIEGALRGDFKSRQEGLAIQRQNGVISANEWRDHEGMNPRDDENGDQYYEQGPSGQTGTPDAGREDGENGTD